MLKKIIGLRLKFILFISALIVLTSVTLNWFFIENEVVQVRKALVDKGKILARNLAYNSEYAVLIGPMLTNELLSKFLESVKREEDVLYCLVLDREGKILDMRGEIDSEEVFTKTEESLSGDLRAKVAEVRLYRSKKGELIYDINSPIKTQNIEGEEVREESIGIARVGLSLVAMNKEINRLRETSFILTLIVAGIGILAAIYLIRKITKPINQLVVGTQRIAGGDLSYRVAIKSRDEVGELAAAFNQMTQDLKKSRDEIENHSKILEQKVEERTKQLKEAEVQLIQSVKMAAVGQLGAGVAHELNNPLGGILGYAQFILEKFRKSDFGIGDFKACQRYLESMEREAVRCKKIVENLLKFSRRPIFAKPEPIDLIQAIEETLSITGHQLKLKNIKVSTDYKPELVKVTGIVNQLQQVFTNIILNAQQAMPEGGELKIRAENIIDPNTQLPTRAKIEFVDSGCGIPEENLQRIFEPFFTTKSEEKGTGLGLAVSYQIVQDHQGSIEVESQVGQGTSFIITLPR